LTTYQRNIQKLLESRSEDEFDEFLGDIVGAAKVETSDGNEAKYDGCRLEDLTAIRPLDALQLGPAGTEEANGAVAAAERCTGRPCDVAACAVAPTACAAPANAAAGFTGSAPPSGLLQRVAGVVVEVVIGVCGCVWCDWGTAGTAHDGCVELVHVRGRVVERRGHVGALERA
jgi:hypothetical protein